MQSFTPATRHEMRRVKIDPSLLNGSEAGVLEAAWDYAVANMRGDRKRVIVEEFVDFDYEITLLTIRTRDGVLFCPPIGHRQERGDYQESWQPAAMSAQAIADANVVVLMLDALSEPGAHDHALDALPQPLAGDMVRRTELPDLLDAWLSRARHGNALNRALGLTDAYPFVIDEGVRDKLAFVHELVRDRALAR